jgi:Tol biopolymer transport system component
LIALFWSGRAWAQQEFPKDPTSKEILRMANVENAYPRWMGEKILFQSNRDGHWQVYVMNLDGSGQKNISNDKFNNNFVSCSAKGDLVAFVSDRDGNEEIYTMKPDGSGIKRLTNDPGRDIHPYITPDGKKILFNSTRNATRGNLEIYSMNVDGTNLKRLTQSVDEKTCARLSPDGSKIVYLLGSESLRNDEIVVTDPNGQHLINVTNSVAAEGWPVWSPDGQRIYYCSDDSGTFCIYEMKPDGSAKKKITEVQFPFMDARPEISRDGKRLLFNRQVANSNGKNTIAIYMKDIKS